MDDFLQDRASNDAAFAKVVDRLLQSPRFGERWGRHWLDVVRYSDSVGRTMNAAFPFARRYRDYVIDAFNQDKPYHRFIAEQVAGDLLPASTPAQRSEQLIATGLLTMASLDLSEGGELFRLDRVDDQIDVTTRAFMGLTISCAGAMTTRRIRSLSGTTTPGGHFLQHPDLVGTAPQGQSRSQRICG